MESDNQVTENKNCKEETPIKTKIETKSRKSSLDGLTTVSENFYLYLNFY